MSITSITDKVSARIAAGAIGAAMIVSLGLGVATQAYAAGLTTSQVQSILSLLQSFGADQATINNVQAALTGQPTTSTGSSSTNTSGATCYPFSSDLTIGSTGSDVMALQEFLNADGAMVASTGAGSPGQETTYFGSLTQAALAKWQAANNVSPAAGYFGPLTRAAIAAVCSTTGNTGTGTNTGTNTGTGTITTGAGVTVSAATQPVNTLAPASASRVPFTTFTLTNNTASAVTVNSVTVQRTGLANDAAFAGVVLLDQNGIQIGTSRTFNSNHQAQIGTPFVLNPGQSETFTIAANMQADEDDYAGQVAALSVVGVNTSVPVSGSLPITGAEQTINGSLSIGTATINQSSYDPDASRSESLGTTGLIFSGVRIQAGSAEDEKLMSITWNQTGSIGSGDLSNLVTVVNGTSYPMTADSTGKYYTATFPGGITLQKGQSVDAYVQGDLTGSDASGRTVEFDVYRPSDIYLVGQTFGYGITPTASDSGTYSVNNNSSSGFQATNNPFYFGATMTVTGGTLSTISSSGSVGAQNIAINTPNQPLGAFTTDFTGEPVTVQSLEMSVSSTTSNSGTGHLTNVSLVDSNGNTVAGPVDEDSSGNLTFNSSITFPTGAMTYTIQGEVPSTAKNGDTYQLSTDPNTDWSGAQGQISGTGVTLPSTTISMPTMTVQGGSLQISAASTPASTDVAPGASNFTIANVNLDASQSGEDVRLASLPIVVNASSTSATDAEMTTLADALTNCQLFNGSTALNNQSIGSSDWKNEGSGVLEANFIFQNSLTIPKGTVVTLALECNISSSITSGYAFTAGVNQTYYPSPTGVQSGDSITATPLTSASGTMTPGSATLAVSNASPLSFAQAAGGTNGVTVGSFTLTPSSDSVNLQKIGLSLDQDTASSSDVMRAYIYNGSTQVGSVIFTNSNPGKEYTYATTSISNLNLPQNVQTTLTIKADLSSIGVGQAGHDGHLVVINLADAQGVGASSGASVQSGKYTGTQSGVAVFRTFPTVALSSYLPSSGVAAGGLIAFSVTANSSNSLSLYQLKFALATSSAKVSSPALYAYSDSGFSQAAGGTSNGVAGTTVLSNDTVTTTMSTPLQIPAGQTYYFLLKGTVAGSGSTYSVATTLDGDSTKPTGVAEASSVSGNFVWSPNGTGTSLTTTSDWTNGYGVQGLPGIGITQSRTN